MNCGFCFLGAEEVNEQLVPTSKKVSNENWATGC